MDDLNITTEKIESFVEKLYAARDKNPALFRALYSAVSKRYKKTLRKKVRTMEEKIDRELAALQRRSARLEHMKRENELLARQEKQQRENISKAVDPKTGVPVLNSWKAICKYTLTTLSERGDFLPAEKDALLKAVETYRPMNVYDVSEAIDCINRGIPIPIPENAW
jgi:hypothetical protein